MDTRSLASIHLSVAGTVYNLGVTAKIGFLLFSMFFMLSFIFDPLKPLSVTPGYLIPPNFWIWTLITHPFIETNIVLLVCGIVALIINSNVLEEPIGFLKLVAYYGIVCVSSAVLSGIFYLILYMLTFNVEYLFDVHIHGAAGIIGGGLVAMKQTHGDQLIIGSVGLRIKDATLLVLVLLIIFRLSNLLRGSYVLVYGFAALTGWTYLRFYQSHSRGRGDQSEKFAFKHFFPEAVQGPVGSISDVIHRFLIKIRICRKTVYRYDVGAPSNITLSLSGVNALDAERRRNKAIKALDERLKKSTSDMASWPALADESGPPAKEESSEATTTEHMPKTDQSSSGDGSTSPDIVTIETELSPNENNSTLG